MPVFEHLRGDNEATPGDELLWRRNASRREPLDELAPRNRENIGEAVRGEPEVSARDADQYGVANNRVERA